MNKYLKVAQNNQENFIPNSYLNIENISWKNGNIIPYGGIVFFSNFLKVSGILEQMVNECPFEYKSHNSPKPSDLIGTIVLSILLGCTRYSHINQFRNDNISPKLLGFEKIVSEDSVRRALKKCNFERVNGWLLKFERIIYNHLISYNYILDIDNTVVPIYGHQEGAEIGYNPSKPGRPNLNYHSYFIGSIRLLLGVDVLNGKQSSGIYGLPGLLRFLDSLLPEYYPRLIRGDIGYAVDKIMSVLEERNVKYLFKLKHTTNVSKKFKELLCKKWFDCGKGWESIETTIQLTGWDKARRVLFVRRPKRNLKPNTEEKTGRGRPKKEKLIQIEFDFFIEKQKNLEWEYYVLITNDYSLNSYELTDLYRNRGDCENNFDELKNQMGWGGFITKDIKSTSIMARLIAIVKNLWNIFCRLANPNKHLEPITSKPLLLYINARLTKSGRKTKIQLSSTNKYATVIKATLTNINYILKCILSKCRAVNKNDCWKEILHIAFMKWLGKKKTFFLENTNQMLLEF
jgi:hypothetical protein